MRLLFRHGGRTGMRDAESVGGGLGLWSPAFGDLLAELGPQNGAWWFDPNSPQPVLLRSAADLVDLVKAEDLDRVGAALWAEAEALAESVKLAEVAQHGEAATRQRL